MQHYKMTNNGNMLYNMQLSFRKYMSNLIFNPIFIDSI
jgi:hypothetical protein